MRPPPRWSRPRASPSHVQHSGNWVNKLHRTRYVELSNEHAGEFLQALKADYREIVKQAGEATLEAIDGRDFDKLDPRDQAGAARNVATVGAIAFDKLAALEDRPAAVVEHHVDADDLLRKLQAMVPAEVEPVDAEVVEE